MNRIHLILTLALLTAVMVSPYEARAVSEMADFSHPASLPEQASDKARDALAARGTHGGDGNDGGSNENAAEVDNSHNVDAGQSVTIEHSVKNDVVNLDLTITVTVGDGVDRDWSISVDPPGTDKDLPAGPPADLPRGPPADVPRND